MVFFDNLVSRAVLSDSLGGQITYSYNGNFQLTGLTMSLSGTLTAQMTFSYDNLGRLAGISRWAGVGSHVISSSYSYDGANRLTGINYADATTGTPLASFTYGYNADDQVASYTGPEGTLNYSYDKDGELTGVSGVAQASYSYDANGNRTMSGYQTGPGNELLSDGQFTYTYDKDGNLLSKRDASGDVWSYSWDYRNRLTEVKETNAQNQVVLDETFQYDVNNNLIGEAVNGVPQRWTVYDGSTPYLDLTDAGQVSERYLADPNVLSAYWARVGVTGQADWMVTDLLGSVRALVSASGSVEDQIAYDAYGNVVSETNPLAGGRLKYAGGQYDGGLGLTLFGARWYNSAAGRWLSQDPLGLGPDMNPYRYSHNSPTTPASPNGDALFGAPSTPVPLLPVQLTTSSRSHRPHSPQMPGQLFQGPLGRPLAEYTRHVFLGGGTKHVEIYPGVVRVTRYNASGVRLYSYTIGLNLLESAIIEANIRRYPNRPARWFIGVPSLIVLRLDFGNE